MTVWREFKYHYFSIPSYNREGKIEKQFYTKENFIRIGSVSKLWLWIKRRFEWYDMSNARYLWRFISFITAVWMYWKWPSLEFIFKIYFQDFGNLIDFQPILFATYYKPLKPNILCISESFNTNISHQLFDYTTTFVNHSTRTQI